MTMTVDAKNKLYIIDTNIILHDPYSILNFAENDLFIPRTVFDELKHHRKKSDTKVNAIKFFRLLFSFLKKGCFADGVVVNDKGGKLYIEEPDLKKMLKGSTNDSEINDYRILNSFLNCKKNFKNTPRIFVTKDIPLAIDANILKIPSQDYLSDKVSEESKTYSGYYEIVCEKEKIDKLASFVSGQKDGIKTNQLIGQFPELTKKSFFSNCFIIFTSKKDNRDPLFLRYFVETKTFKIEKVNCEMNGYSLLPKNLEQRLALHLFSHKDIDLVTIDGPAGTGKTLLSLMEGRKRIKDSKGTQKMVVYRINYEIGQSHHEIGILKGGLDSKFGPYKKVIEELLNFIVSNEKGVDDLIDQTQQKIQLSRRKQKRKGDESNSMPALKDWAKIMVDAGFLEIIPVAYERGRTIRDAVLIVDEAQNLTPREAKAILTRVGDGVKVILVGDIDQIDAPFLDSASCGLFYVKDRLKKEDRIAHISLLEGHRSYIANLCAKKL